MNDDEEINESSSAEPPENLAGETAGDVNFDEFSHDAGDPTLSGGSAESNNDLADSADESPVDPIPDTRLYIPNDEDWDVHIKRDSDRMYCYSKHPGQDWFHLLLHGEIYVSRHHEKYCLRCALRMGFLTEDRLFWQHRVPRRRNDVI